MGNKNILVLHKSLEDDHAAPLRDRTTTESTKKTYKGDLAVIIRAILSNFPLSENILT